MKKKKINTDLISHINDSTSCRVILGEFYFEKYFRYNKMKELENIILLWTMK